MKKIIFLVAIAITCHLNLRAQPAFRLKNDTNCDILWTAVGVCPDNCSTYNTGMYTILGAGSTFSLAAGSHPFTANPTCQNWEYLYVEIIAYNSCGFHLYVIEPEANITCDAALGLCGGVIPYCTSWDTQADCNPDCSTYPIGMPDGQVEAIWNHAAGDRKSVV